MEIKTTQIEEIDRQHAGLVKALDELMAYAGGHYDFSASLTALGSLLEYTQAHFSYEEQLMREWDYPHLKEHLAQHAGFTAQVEALWKSAEAGEVMSGEIISMVRDWIIRHINEEDVQYATVARRPDGRRGGPEASHGAELRGLPRAQGLPRRGSEHRLRAHLAGQPGSDARERASGDLAGAEGCLLAAPGGGPPELPPMV